ncbi:MAG TPA: SusC/RagA family TonB-linked outer membrane protein [Leeuwenhoekiella sp.]|nr:SusC/RagA family TonB-linked outer membrane protein [Leeuwenhoekiella sp.]
MKTKFTWYFVMGFFLLAQISFAQQKTVTGTVTDQDGFELPGVNIIEEGTSNGQQTNFDGQYSIEVEQGSTLIFSYVGFKDEEVQVGQSNTYDVVMEQGESLEEVIVTGYGQQSRELSTSAVSTVTSEEIENLVPSTSVDNILQGKAAGVQVTAANGRPGQTAFVQIRGAGSINASTAPLYIVDGVPINQADVNNINPNDIAQFSILKDAATVSKYGSRGANGVVLITTKRGSKGDAKIVFRSSVGSGSKIDDPFDLMDASQKLELERQYAALGVNGADVLPGASASPERLAQLISYDTDWEEELLRNSYIQSNSLSISGGADKLTYFLSLGYDKNSGILDRIDGFERVSARLNSTYEAKDWLTVGTNISLARNTTDLPRDRNNVQNPFRALYDYNPYDPLYARDADGNVATSADGSPIFNTSGSIQGFPIARALKTEPEDNRNFLIIGSLFADLKINDKFSNRFQVGGTSNRYNRTNRSLAGGVLNSAVGNSDFPGTQTDNYSQDFEYNVNNVLSYSDTFGELHNFRADFLLEYNERIYTELRAGSRGYPTPDIPYQIIAAEPTLAYSTEARRVLFSQGLFVDYDYDGKYLASASIRSDGSSRFGPNNKYGYFYSGSLGWNIAREDFMEGSFFNDLKLRGSYGTAGNQNIPDFQYLNLLGFDSTYNGSTTAVPVGVGNPDVKWEAQSTLDIGVEFSMLNRRLRGVVDYYVKTSDDLLLNRPISNTVGDENNSILSNIGEIENKGLEVTLSGDIVRNQNLRWTIGGNVAFLDNEVKKLVNGVDIDNGTTILREGEERYTFNLVRYAGVNPANGQALYLDTEGNVTSEYLSGNNTVLSGKSPIANIEGGFYTSINYKGFGLRADFVGKAGNYILNYQRSDGVAIGGIGNSNRRVEAFNYWKNPGDQNVLPSPLYQGTADQTSTRFLEKGDYVRLRTLTLDYNLPSQFLNDNLGIDSFRIYATGQNILTFSKYEGDPEIGIGSGETANAGGRNSQATTGFVPGEFSLYSYPQTKSYTIGIEVGF